MHELSIAVSLVEAVCEHLEQLGNVRVTAVHLRVGPLAGVVPDALLFSFDVAAAGSAIEGARLAIEQVPLVAWCDRCGTEQPIASPQLMQCPSCHAPTARVVSGCDLELAAVEVVDDGTDR